ncbi:methyltransferase domain-containing protein [Pseudooceanicola sp. CBS1P-1]|uniref:Methyltransferase domain-containing protein n=1 Tax=Pseudooceanicola albus TaxID=2692189 RepID=A0A6L7GAW8_9RHOB|nr:MULTISPECIES: methyltransferase [Pseudooceanicola]MBT9384339.1 methyltransferase domain-containing protein [Pseudooceanicola endophyticus]MXN19923.1 methyltransferase domain-containing protein [Pseudooceanicola albus]
MTAEGIRAGARLEAALLDDLPALVALRTALACGLFAGGPLPPEAGWVADTLLALGALERGASGWQPTLAMRALLDPPGDLAVRADFIARAASDLLRDGTLMSRDPAAFLARAETFRFFRYDRARGTGAAQIEDTAPWVAYVTALSRREAPHLAPLLPLAGCADLLEIGGNTGVMAETLLAAHPGMRACVLDLPAVCHLGRARMRGRSQADRLDFLPGDARSLPWPAADAVLFKSVLHDWTLPEATALLQRAIAALRPGGRIVVCERGALRDDPPPRGLSAAANLVFAPFYRAPAAYAAVLEAAGLRLWPARQVTLDMTFHVLVAEAPS